MFPQGQVRQFTLRVVLGLLKYPLLQLSVSPLARVGNAGAAVRPSKGPSLACADFCCIVSATASVFVVWPRCHVEVAAVAQGA